jgi:hypothetical protein
MLTFDGSTTSQLVLGQVFIEGFGDCTIGGSLGVELPPLPPQLVKIKIKLICNK